MIKSKKKKKRLKKKVSRLRMRGGGGGGGEGAGNPLWVEGLGMSYAGIEGQYYRCTGSNSIIDMFPEIFYATLIKNYKISGIDIVTQTLFGSRMNWIYDPAPPAPRRANMQSRDTHVNSCDPPVLSSDTQASAIAIRASSGAPLALPHPKKPRRWRNRRSANENSVPRSATPVTPDERWANRNSGFQRATQHQSEASDPTQMMSTPVYQEQSFHSSHLPPPPIPATNRNSAFQFGLDHCEFPGLYKPAFPDLRQDLNTTPSRVNN